MQLNKGFDHVDADAGAAATLEDMGMRITTSARSPIEERITLEERMPAELAATRVQAVARGRRTRKTLSIIAEASSTPEVAATSEPPTSTAAAAGATPARLVGGVRL